MGVGYGRAQSGADIARSDATEKSYRAHRYAWMLEVGAIPDGLHVLPMRYALMRTADHLFAARMPTTCRTFSRRTDGSRQLKNNAWKLTAQDVVAIRTLYAAGGTSFRRLGRMFGIHHSHVRAVVRGTRWTYPTLTAMKRTVTTKPGRCTSSVQSPYFLPHLLLALLLVVLPISLSINELHHSAPPENRTQNLLIKSQLL